MGASYAVNVSHSTEQAEKGVAFNISIEKV